MQDRAYWFSKSQGESGSMETNQATKTVHLDKFIVGSVPTVIYIPNFIGDTEEEQLVKNVLYSYYVIWSLSPFIFKI